MSRPREYGARVATQVRLEPDLHQRLHEAAEDRDVSVNWLVTKALGHFLDRLIPADEIEWTRGS